MTEQTEQNTPDVPEWVKDAVFYQIFPDRFAKSDRIVKPNNLEPWGAPPSENGYQGGDLLGIVEHLDYLTELGVNALYLNPIFQSASNHRYHTHDYMKVDPLLGGDAALRELVDKGYLDMEVLAEMERDELVKALTILADDYATWIDE